MADKYVIRVTAGPAYDLDQHVEVPVNKADPVKITSEHMDIELNVRIQGYKGLPRNSPKTSPYFDHEPHASNKDQYSIAFRFTPKKPGTNGSAAAQNGNAKAPTKPSPSTSSDDEGVEEQEERVKQEEEEEEGISALDLQFGNDFDHPIRDRLPPGFNTAMNIVKWWIDPGLEGDAYADEPYLYGPALSSLNVVHVGEGEYDASKGGLWFEEGASDAKGRRQRERAGAPEDGKSRMKWALKKESKEGWVWGFGRTYGVDFFNPYVDFGEFALRLPGFHLPIIRYWDGQGLRYVLRNRSTGQVYLVVLFSLHLKDDVNEDGTIKKSAVEAAAKASGGKGKGKGEPVDGADKDGGGGGDFDEQKALDEARRKLSGVDISGGGGNGGGNDDDID